ncbi:GATA transcription factor 12-like [Cynara cardunculus var. scolymus]|uniref:GATA transcription factor n=1 Tax=Cynara cardunculus var. scolymus TaxID=59895 RepID=A0A103XW61_CYNCS|nr:GATA transcription factor 12-like [Cynara cardunculus var. scolymus]KVH97998.1 Transcription factor, GATA, plant [Cynara cardunculus var. scolymus]
MAMEEPDYFIGDYFGVGECYFGHQKPTDIINNNNQFIIDDLLVDFPNNDDVVLNDAFFDNVNGRSTDSSTVTAVDSCNSSVSGGEAPFSGNISSRRFSESQFSGVEICLPYDDLAELEWLSNFTQESFSTDDFQNLQIISAANKAPATDTSSSNTTPEFRLKPVVATRINSEIFQTDVFVPGKARSKRSRMAPCDWNSRILHLKSSSTNTDIKPKPTSFKRREIPETSIVRCLHCGSDKTPQWRTGPMGPKTLCNACGVRYKSGRLVPEYRPAASPTYVSAKHSNSHRKVMEIRRQKELRNAHHELVNRSSVLHESNSRDDCLIDSQSGPIFMEMI